MQLHFEQILSLLRTGFEYIVIDTNALFDEFTLRTLDESDLILLVLTADLPSIYNSRRCLEVFEKMGYEKEKIRLIMNRYSSNSGVDLQELEKSIDYPVFWKIPNQDYPTAVNSVNQGIPLSTLNARSKISQSFRFLTEQVNGHHMPEMKNDETTDDKSFVKKLLFSKTRK
jgi:pilus assembly protein CpaE